MFWSSDVLKFWWNRFPAECILFVWSVWLVFKKRNLFEIHRFAWVTSPRITCITGKIRFSIVLYKKVSDDPERRKLIPQLQMLNICSFTQLWMGFYATWEVVSLPSCSVFVLGVSSSVALPSSSSLEFLARVSRDLINCAYSSIITFTWLTNAA